MSDESNIKIGRDALKVAHKMADEFGISQKLIVEQAIHDFYNRHINEPTLAIQRMSVRERNARYGQRSQGPDSPTNP